MVKTQEQLPESKSHADATRDDSGPFQNTPFNRLVVAVVGLVWAVCGTVAIPQLMQQPAQLSLLSAYELAGAAMLMGFCCCAWAISTSPVVASIAQRAGNNAGKLLLFIALPAIIDFLLNLL